MNVPTSIDGWTYEVVEKLVEEGYLETDFYEFKEFLNTREPGFKQRLTDTACAFANTKGGFIIFGIKDLKKKSLGIVGIPSSSNLAKQFGDKIRGAWPSIHFEFSNPPIPTKETGRVLFVVHVPRSPDRPHQNNRGAFYQRTNQGNELMSYEQVRGGFLGYEERRYKMKLLYIELLSIANDAQSTIISDEKADQQYSLITLDSTVLSSLLVDVYSLIQDDKALVRELLQIRQAVSVMNNQIRTFFSTIVLPRMNMAEIIRSHNEAIRGRAQTLTPMIGEALVRLETRYGLTNPFSS